MREVNENITKKRLRAGINRIRPETSITLHNVTPSHSACHPSDAETLYPAGQGSFRPLAASVQPEDVVEKQTMDFPDTGRTNGRWPNRPETGKKTGLPARRRGGFPVPEEAAEALIGDFAEF